MPSERKQLTCRNCNGDFSVPKSRGSYPSVCLKPECQGSAFRSAAQRKHDRDSHRRTYHERKAEQPVTKPPPPKSEPERTFIDTSCLDRELSAITERAAGRSASRPDVAREVRKLAYAEGVEQTYDRLLELAATATAFAQRIRPLDLRPAYVESEEDFEELMAA